MSSEQDHVLLPVADLASAERVYCQILQPLGYAIVGYSQHSQINGAGSRTVDFGPTGTSRVDFKLSQSDSTYGRHRAKNHGPSVVFPVASRHEVRDFYASALESGCRILQKPVDDPETGNFAAKIADEDGNQIEVQFESGNPPPAALPAPDHAEMGSRPPGGRVDRWVSDVIEDSPPTSPHGDLASRYSHRSRHSKTTYMVRDPPSATSSRKTSSSSGHTYYSNSSRSDHHSSSPIAETTSHGIGSKTVMGGIIGVAAAGALVYSMFSSREESKTREMDYHDRVSARDRLRTEARDSRDSHPMPAYDHYAPPSPRRSSTHKQPLPPDYHRGYITDRDSGYHSARDSEADSRRRAYKYRTASYTQPSTSAAPPREESRTRRITYDYGTRAIEAAPASAASSSHRSESTIKPLPHQHHRRDSVTKLSGPHPPSSLPPSMAPPSMPPLPGDHSSRGRARAPPVAPSAESSRRLARSPSPRARSQRSRSASSRNDDYAARPPSTSSRTRASSARTAQRVPLPPSDSGSGSARSVRSARNIPLPPSEAPAPSATLTEKNLLKATGRLGLEPTGSRLDDMETVVPDDSISVCPTPEEKEREQRRRRAPADDRRSRTSRGSTGMGGRREIIVR